MTEENPISGKDFLKFMNDFKTNIEKTMKSVEMNINNKIEAKLVKLDDGMKNLKENIKVNDDKTEELKKILNGRMSRIEEDMKRMRYKNMKSDTLERNAKKKQEEEKEEKEKDETPATRKKDEDENKIVRSDSWAKEVEDEIARGDNETMKEIDRAQWMNKQRNPACWTEGLRATVKQREPEKEKKDKINKEVIKRWFGYDDTDGEESTTEDEKEDDTEWTMIERKEKKKGKEKKRQMKRHKRKEETASKAQMMVGLGPINYETYEREMKVEKDYEKNKKNLAKEHLRHYYKYNEEEIKTTRNY